MDTNGPKSPLRGIIVEADWDERYRPVAIALATHWEEEYLVDMDEQGQLLLRKHILDTVEVSGEAYTDSRGERYVRVISFRIIDDELPGWDELSHGKMEPDAEKRRNTKT
jgi:hypothetical protein